MGHLVLLMEYTELQSHYDYMYIHSLESGYKTWIMFFIQTEIAEYLTPFCSAFGYNVCPLTSMRKIICFIDTKWNLAKSCQNVVEIQNLK